MTGRLIDADAFYNDLKVIAEYADKDFREEIYRMMARLSSRPTIDAVEVVRCKNCTFFDIDTHQCKRQLYTVVYENDFCPYGKEKADDCGKCR